MDCLPLWFIILCVIETSSINSLAPIPASPKKMAGSTPRKSPEKVTTSRGTRETALPVPNTSRHPPEAPTNSPAESAGEENPTNGSVRPEVLGAELKNHSPKKPSERSPRRPEYRTPKDVNENSSSSPRRRGDQSTRPTSGNLPRPHVDQSLSSDEDSVRYSARRRSRRKKLVQFEGVEMPFTETGRFFMYCLLCLGFSLSLTTFIIVNRRYLFGRFRRRRDYNLEDL